jgi:hypothetical protein
MMVMDKPERLVLKKRSGYRNGCLIGLACLFFPAVALGLGYFSGSKPEELALPAVVLGGLAVVVVIVILGAVSITVLWERRNIRRLLSSDLWAQWQYTPDEWKRIATDLLESEEGVYKPIYNLIIGPIVGAIIAGFGLYMNDREPEMTPILLLIGGGVAVVFILSGLILPLVQRSNRQARYRRRLRVEAPRLYIGPNALYHEADGYESLARLNSVEYTPGDSAITFKVYVQAGHYGSYLSPITQFVPRGRETEAQALVERFTRERPMERGLWRSLF